ncbi:MAG: type II toxin-antitoxin system PemK/MazF family toxin [Gemmataceae bacterium]|nr:type II toxin-antitoxin system PemK/MazF family toxin [Gemmataceae bacterium]
MTRGEVVLVDWVYSDMKGAKLRPAVVVQADFLNGLIDDTILVQITGTRHAIPGTEVLLDPAQETGSGLLKVSYASCTNVVTLDQALIYQTIGYLSDAAMKQIDDCLKVVLGLP